MMDELMHENALLLHLALDGNLYSACADVNKPCYTVMTFSLDHSEQSSLISRLTFVTFLVVALPLRSGYLYYILPKVPNTGGTSAADLAIGASTRVGLRLSLKRNEHVISVSD